MTARIAMMHTSFSFEGGWWRVKPGDNALRISGLSSGDKILLEGDLSEEFSANGVFSLPFNAGQRCRLVKDATSPAPSPTTVEILNG